MCNTAIVLGDTIKSTFCVCVCVCVNRCPFTELDILRGLHEFEVPRVFISRQLKLTSLSAQRTGCFYPQGKFLFPNSFSGWVRPQGHSAAGKIESKKSLKDPTGNRTRDPPACSAMRYRVSPPRVCMCLCLEMYGFWTFSLSGIESRKHNVVWHTNRLILSVILYYSQKSSGLKNACIFFIWFIYVMIYHVSEDSQCTYSLA